MSDFNVRFALQKRSQTSPKSIMALQNMKKWTKKIIWHFGIWPGHFINDGREYCAKKYSQYEGFTVYTVLDHESNNMLLHLENCRYRLIVGFQEQPVECE